MIQSFSEWALVSIIEAGSPLGEIYIFAGLVFN
jgi:hypothetical protein